jgi:hypothetical protein
MSSVGRGVRSLRFIPTVAEISAADAGEVPGLEVVVSHWTEGALSASEWYAEVSEAWGTAGFTVRRGEDVLGFALYGPLTHLPRAGRYPVGPVGEDAALLAYLEGDGRTRRRLLVRVMRDLKLRGFGGIEAIGSDAGLSRHVPTRFLLESGWKPVRRGWRAGRAYTLARADFGDTVEVGQLARGLMGRMKLPVLKVPAPGALASGRATTASTVSPR